MLIKKKSPTKSISNKKIINSTNTLTALYMDRQQTEHERGMLTASTIETFPLTISGPVSCGTNFPNFTA